MVLLAVRIALQFFQKSRECQNKGLSSTSTEHGPAIVRIKKLQALVDFISNCAFLILSIGTAYILYFGSTVNSYKVTSANNNF